ncbi:RNA 2',3'-cyclic phosphodiesterase [Nocardioides marmotae]|uniref:RNA 2',3'-cyclic phosphodiesterase n=1 Tax=Nocardioides marmotae TaxID=2663857 RepID=UPI00132A2B61|nr:RNA 2',3'-cyclic phosphodiesterase [Nocardioides marmotae]MBC9734277.1 RNA 2',3'-cyclic phosphodiesterase [Nocardioides marmotae]MTB85378.1 RNA 2',3'-cyclic phosphodiesterase [Nocardioides marmotae]
MRHFAALVPPEEAVEHLDDFLEARREAGPFRWTAAEQLHLTLAFYADVPDHALDELVERLGTAARRRTPFRARVAGGGAFPDVARARVLWAGLDLDEGAAAELDRLATGCRHAASRSGVGVDGQRFRPHLTLARLGRPAEVTRWVRLLDAYAGPSWTADRVTLVESHLGEGPRRRPRHEVVADLPLGGVDLG